MSGTLDSWIGTSGSWSTHNNWQNGLPNAGSLAGFGGTLAETITFATTAAIDGIAGSDAAATLDITSGALTIGTGGGWTGSVLLAGGTLTLNADVLTLSGSFTERPAGTAAITGGATLSLAGGGTLNGSVTGAGTLLLGGGENYTVGSAKALGAGTVEISDNGGTVTLGAAATVGGSFLLYSGDVALGGNTLTLAGGAYLDGALSGPGEVAVTAPATIGYLTVNDGATLSDSSTLLESGDLQLGSGTADSATLNIAAGATYDIVNDVGIGADGTASIVNAGVFEKSGGAGNSFIAADLDSTGKIVVAQGTVGLEGTSDTIGGSLSGAGTLEVLVGTLDLTTASVALGGFGAYDYATVLELGASPTLAGSFVLDGATLDLDGKKLTLKGGDYLRGLIEGPGSVIVSGSADLGYLTLSGGAVLADAKLVTTDDPLTLGTGTADSARLTIDAGATFDLLYSSNSNIGANGTAAIGNAGLFEMTGAGGVTTVYADMTSTGKLEAIAGNTLQLGGASNALSGSLLGSGEIDLLNGGTFGIAAGTTLGVATLGVYGNDTTVQMAGTATYAGTLLMGGGTIDYAASGALTLTGWADLGGTLAGPVVVTAKGGAQTGGLVLTGGATLIDAVSATLNGNATLGTGTADQATLQVKAGATFDIASDGTILARGTALIGNVGLFEKTAATGTSIVQADIDSTGTVVDTIGTLALEGASDTIGGGGLQGAGEIDLRGGGTFAIGAGVSLGVATLGIFDNATTVGFSANESYTGIFTLGGGATLDLNGATMTLDTASLDGNVVGGTVLVETSAETGGLVLTGGATLDDASVAVLDNANVTIGTATADVATLLVGAGATYDIRTDNSINANGTAVIDNLGLFEKTGFTGTSTIYADMDSTGTLAVNEGTLSLSDSANTLGGSVTGSGQLNLRDGSATTLAAGLSLTVGTLDILDQNTEVSLAGNVLYKGAFTLGSYATLLLNGHHFTESGTGLLQGGIDGPGEFIVSGSSDAQYVLLTAGATLEVTGTLTQDRYITLGTSTADSATIAVAAGGTYDLISDDAINAAGTATITNAGTFEKTQTDGTSTVAAAVVNTKLIAANLGTIAFDGTLTNDGTVTATGASVLVNDALTGAGGKGVFDIGKNGSVVIGGTVGVDASQTFAFTGTNGTLRIYDPSAFAGSITGFASGDTIDLGNIQANGLSYSNGDLIVTETVNGTLDATYTLSAPGIANPGSLALVYDNDYGTAIVLNHAGPDFTNPSGTITADYWTLDANANWNGDGWYRVVQLVPLETVDIPANAGNDAEFDLNGTSDAVITYDETDTVNRLDADGYATLDVTGGTLTINAGGGWTGGFNITAGTLDAVTGWSVYGPSNLGAGATDEVDAGTFGIGSGTLAGTVDGQGQFYLEGGNNFTIDPGFTITSGAFDLGVDGDGFGSNTTLDANLKYAGTFILTDYTGNSANLYLNGKTLTLTGSTADLNGYVSGRGGLTLNGTAEVGSLTVNNSAVITVNGTVVQDGFLETGNAGTISPDATTVNISKTGTWDFVNNSSILGYGATTVDNAGLLEKTGGTGDSDIGGSVFIDTGTIAVDAGQISIGANSNTIEGAIGGPGDLYFDGGPTIAFFIGQGAAITTAQWELGLNSDGYGSNTTLDTSLSYGGNFILADYSGNSANFFLNGQTLTLAGSSYLNGYLSGTGVLDITGTADIAGQTINNSATVNVTGTMTQDGLLELGTGNSPDATAINIVAGGTYDILDDAGMNVYGNTTIDNAGLFEKTGGTGVSDLYYGGTFTNTGTVVIATGWIDFGGTNNLGGTITGAGNLGLLVGISTLDPGAKITVANTALLLNGDGFGASLVLDENFTYGGSFESYDYSGNATYLDLNGFNATFTGASLWNGQLNGAGTLGLAGMATIEGEGASGAVVDVTGTADFDREPLHGQHGRAGDRQDRRVRHARRRRCRNQCQHRHQCRPDREDRRHRDQLYPGQPDQHRHDQCRDRDDRVPGCRQQHHRRHGERRRDDLAGQRRQLHDRRRHEADRRQSWAVRQHPVRRQCQLREQLRLRRRHARPQRTHGHAVRAGHAQRHRGRRRHADDLAQDDSRHQRAYARRRNSAEPCRHAGQRRRDDVWHRHIRRHHARHRRDRRAQPQLRQLQRLFRRTGADECGADREDRPHRDEFDGRLADQHRHDPGERGHAAGADPGRQQHRRHGRGRRRVRAAGRQQHAGAGRRAHGRGFLAGRRRHQRVEPEPDLCGRLHAERCDGKPARRHADLDRDRQPRRRDADRPRPAGHDGDDGGRVPDARRRRDAGQRGPARRDRQRDAGRRHGTGYGGERRSRYLELHRRRRHVHRRQHRGQLRQFRLAGKDRRHRGELHRGELQQRGRRDDRCRHRADRDRDRQRRVRGHGGGRGIAAGQCVCDHQQPCGQRRQSELCRRAQRVRHDRRYRRDAVHRRHALRRRQDRPGVARARADQRQRRRRRDGRVPRCYRHACVGEPRGICGHHCRHGRGRHDRPVEHAGIHGHRSDVRRAHADNRRRRRHELPAAHGRQLHECELPRRRGRAQRRGDHDLTVVRRAAGRRASAAPGWRSAAG